MLDGASNILKTSVELASEKGASNWLTVLPLQEHNFTLLSMMQLLSDMDGNQSGSPNTVLVEKSFQSNMLLLVPRVAFHASIRHNEIRDFTAGLLTEVCHEVEPHLQPVTSEKFILTSSNTEDGARLDISANGFWGGRCEKTYIDIKVFNPHAPSNRTTNSKAIYRKHELCKKRSYDARIHEVEHSSFTPLIFLATGGMAAEATVFYKPIAAAKI